MPYPTVTAVCDAMRNAKNSFRTLCDIRVSVDKESEPIYRASSRSVRFNVEIGGVQRSIRVFTGRVAVSTDESCQRLKKELLIITTEGAKYVDVLVEEPFTLRNPTEPMIEIHENRARFCRGDFWGFTDEKGSVVVEPCYESVDDFSEGRAVVCREGAFGLIDTEGNEIVKPIYDDLSYDGSHLCYTERDGLFGVVDRSGHVIVNNEWDWMGEYSQGMLLVELSGKYGYLDQNGEIVIEIKYEDATSFDHNGYATVTLGGRTYPIDKEEFRV